MRPLNLEDAEMIEAEDVECGSRVYAHAREHHRLHNFPLSAPLVKWSWHGLVSEPWEAASSGGRVV